MKKYFILIAVTISFIFIGNAQTKGVKIGYIDMEYILQNVSDYNEAKSQLEQKANKWKEDIEIKKSEIAKLKDALNTERSLLTKELISERDEEIKFREEELLDFQQKKFGPNGDLITQKAVLVKPIQDQVFTAAQDIAEMKRYDFIFDKSSNLTILFAAKRFDISEQVLRVLNRAERREQLTKKQLKELEAKEYQEDLEDENPELAARKKALEEKNAAREKLLEERRQAAEAKKAEREAERQKLIDEREAKKNGTVPVNDKIEIQKTEVDNSKKVETISTEKKVDSQQTESPVTIDENSREAKAAAKEQALEDRKRELEERRKKILEEREAAKKAREEQLNQPKTEN